MAEVLARLYHLTGESDWRGRAEAVLRAFSGLGDRLSAAPTLLAAADLLEEGATVVVAGRLADAGDPGLAESGPQRSRSSRLRPACQLAGRAFRPVIPRTARRGGGPAGGLSVPPRRLRPADHRSGRPRAGIARGDGAGPS